MGWLVGVALLSGGCADSGKGGASDWTGGDGAAQADGWRAGEGDSGLGRGNADGWGAGGDAGGEPGDAGGEPGDAGGTKGDAGGEPGDAGGTKGDGAITDASPPWDGGTDAGPTPDGGGTQDAGQPDGGAPDTGPPGDPCDPPNTVLVDGACLPSCGGAGGTICTSPDSGLCAGEPLLASWDCPTCCTHCDRSSPESNQPLVHPYGFFQAAAGGIDGPMNEALIQPGLDVTFAVANPTFEPGPMHPNSGCGAPMGATYGTCAPWTEPFAAWKGKGARLAKRVTDEELSAWLACGPVAAADVVERLLRFGWDGISVDELKGTAWSDDGPWGPPLVAMLQELTARGLGRRVILWFSPGTTEVWRMPAAPGASQGTLSKYQKLFAACITHCRKMAFETYPADASTPDPAKHIVTTTVVNNGSDEMLERLAIRIMRIQEGANNVSIAGIGLADEANLKYLNQPQCDIAPFKGSCKTAGSLYKQFARMHNGVAHNWRGVAFYKPGGVHGGNGVWTVEDVAAHVANLTNWWVGK